MNAEVRLTARMLRALAFLPWLNAGLLIVSAAALLLRDGNRVLPSLAVVVGVVASFYGFRVVLDAWLFEDILEEKLTTAELDALVGKPDRPWPERCRGARRLMVIGAVATVLQAILVLVAGVIS